MKLYFYLFKNNFILNNFVYLFLAGLGLCCYAGLPLVVAGRGCPLLQYTR